MMDTGIVRESNTWGSWGMVCAYNLIDRKLAKKIKLVMTDVDDTITSADGSFCPQVRSSIARLKEQGLLVGLISGRNMASLEICARDLNINGPLISENGGQIRLHLDGANLFFGHQEIVLKAYDKLKLCYGDAINGGDWNNERVTDLIVTHADIPPGELSGLTDDIEIVETNYLHENQCVVHLAEKGVNKGSALRSVLFGLGLGEIKLENTLVFGDGLNDLSLFETFPHSVLIPNPNLSNQQQARVINSACFVANKPGGEGFAEVVEYFLQLRDAIEVRAYF
jgi:hydroxymethylpyrimidine pyrophosphatase-like HAD family hydrolase